MRSKMSSGFVRSAIHYSLVIAIPLTGPIALAASVDQPAREFHELLRSTLPSPMTSPEAMARIHMLPDNKILQAIDANSPESALELVSQTSLSNLVAETLAHQTDKMIDAEAALRKEPITMVIVPGIFGEFIPTRGFEDVLMQPSQEREQFKAAVEKAAKAGDANAKDSRFSITALENKDVSLNDVINVGSLKGKDGKTLARVVLLYTDFMSLESLGDLKIHAEKFNRRLSKYLALTGKQKIALVGYSRGTTLALEMLAQAKEQNLPYLSSVKGMIGLGGVIWGSALADDTQNEKSIMTSLVSEVQSLRNNVNPDSRTQTLLAWTKFAAKVAFILPKMNNKANAPKASDLKNAQVPTSLDTKSILTLVKTAWTSLGLSKPISDFGNNVRRFQSVVDAALSGVDSLTSKSRQAWWSTRTLPKSVTYYSMTAAMANPEANDLEKSIFDGAFGYSKRSYDDLMLLQNRLDYESLGKISLNDSQVSVAQAMFLPEAAAALNPANSGLKTQMLGTLGTHHWGLALRIVNAMKDGRTNPFPREALLKALAAKVASDAKSSSRQ
jgi:pimeloyl-ACP methyl ester carboxylesterase